MGMAAALISDAHTVAQADPLAGLPEDPAESLLTHVDSIIR